MGARHHRLLAVTWDRGAQGKLTLRQQAERNGIQVKGLGKGRAVKRPTLWGWDHSCWATRVEAKDGLAWAPGQEVDAAEADASG